MTEPRTTDPRQAALAIAFLGGLFGYGLGIAVTYLPRDPWGAEPAAMAAIPTAYIHIGASIVALAFGVAYVAVYKDRLRAAFEDVSTQA